MFRALWLLAKISVFIGLVVWIAERPGQVTINWLEYTVRIQVGFFLLLVLLIVIIGIIIFSIIKGALDFPATLARYRAYMNRARGLRALTLGLSAVAAGDAKAASYQAARAQKYLSEKEALPKLLSAQALRLSGDEAKATKVFVELVQHKDASFLGVRGLLQATLESEDFSQALELARKALGMYPKQGWILQIVYDLEIKLREWVSADKTLVRVENAGLVSREKAKSDRVAMLLAQAFDAQEKNNQQDYLKLLQRAYKIDRNFIPTVVLLGRLQLSKGKQRACLSMIGEVWRVSPHPDLVTLWDEAMPPSKEQQGLAKIHWYERLLNLKPDSVEALQALARVLTQEGLWGEARKHLEKAQTIRPNVNLYKIWANLEDRATGNQNAVKAWLEKAADAPRERVWICSETGRIYDAWSPVSDQGLFNTIIWDFPQGRSVGSNILSKPPQKLAALQAAV